MKEKIANLFENIFGATLMCSILAGAVVAIMYIIGFIFGGTIGTQLALLGAKIMKYCITISAVASMIGMIAFYIENTHELTIDFKEEEDLTA